MKPGDGFVFDEFTLHGPGLEPAKDSKVAFVFRFVNARLDKINRKDIILPIRKEGANLTNFHLRFNLIKKIKLV